MIKLIVSDIDGTLLPYGETVLDPALFPIIRRLEEQGVRFCPASGRQYHSLRQLFAPVQDELTYLCENGAILYGPGPEDDAQPFGAVVMDRDAALSLCRDILDLPGRELLVSGTNCSYLYRCSPDFVRHMTDFKGNRVTVLDRLEDLPDTILKVSAYCPHGTQDAEQRLGPVWSVPFRMAVAGADWLDFTLADKGMGLHNLCQALSVQPEEVAAFGDNWNDVSMLETAGHPFLMSSADPVLLDRFPRHCGSVIQMLDAFLRTGSFPL